MDLKYKLVIGFIILFIINVTAQINHPMIGFDRVEKIKDEEKKINSTIYRDHNRIVAEKHYPIKGSIQSFCNRSNVVYDSVFIYRYSGRIEEIKFQKNNKIIHNKWQENDNVVYTYIYNQNEKLIVKYQQKYVTDFIHPSIKCSNNKYYVGEYIEYDDSGNEKMYKSYNTGKLKLKNNQPENNRKELKRLKKIADKIIANNYGQEFFDNHIAINYFYCSAYNQKSHSYRRNNGMPSISYNDGWFQQWNDEVTFVDLTYDIKVSEKEKYPLIRIRLDKNGELINVVDYSNRKNKPFTHGLLNNKITSLPNKEEVLKKAIKEGFNEKSLNVIVNLIWEEDEISSTKGKLLYEIFFNKIEKNISGCRMYNYLKWTYDPVLNTFEKDQEFQPGICSPISKKVRKNSENKYGVTSDFSNDPIIEFKYEYLQRQFSNFMIAKLNGKYGLINKKEEILIPFNYDQIKWIETDKKRYDKEFCKLKSGEFYGLYNKEGKEILPIEFSSIKVSKDTIKLIKNEKEIIFDLETKSVR